jgi:GNAT superfamily N-acetyltransferase
VISLEVRAKLLPAQKNLVDSLIYDVWSFEEQSTSEVELIVSEIGSVIDPLDQGATHFLGMDDCNLVAYGRITILQPSLGRLNELPFDMSAETCAYISRLVVHPSARGRGISGLIDEARISFARAHNVNAIYGCAVGANRQNSLLKAGYQKQSPIPNFDNPWYRTTRNVQLMKLVLSPGNIELTGTSL